MAKSKSKTFQSVDDRTFTVVVPGVENFTFEPGKVRTVTTDNPAVVAAFEANPDLSEVKGK